ncbi:MAG: hypothetical protein MUO50_07490 [Longimicrobiales bacterium]|nr:hypothetical protein [Longimicrobiales bacterium]
MAVLSLSDFGSPQAATRDARVAQRRQLGRGAFKKREIFEGLVDACIAAHRLRVCRR